jgi:hypothetical protein
LTLFGAVWGGEDELVAGGGAPNDRFTRSFRFTFMGSAPPPPPPRLHVFMPINQAVAGQRFCRSYLSAVVNGYEPVLYNWDLEGSNREMQKAKIAGTFRDLRFHRALQGAHDRFRSPRCARLVPRQC